MPNRRNYEWPQAEAWNGFFTQDKAGGVTERVGPDTVMARLVAEGFLRQGSIATMSKSKTITIQTPVAGDEVAILYTLEAATLQAIHAATVGDTSVTLRVFQGASLGLGVGGVACCAETVIAPADGAKTIPVTVSAVAQGVFVYLVVGAVVGSPTSVSLFATYTGGE